MYSLPYIQKKSKSLDAVLMQYGLTNQAYIDIEWNTTPQKRSCA